MLKYGAQNTIECLLPVLDNLERGASSLSATSDPKLLYQSFTMLANQLLAEQRPIKRVRDLKVKDATGEAFLQFARNTVGGMSKMEDIYADVLKEDTKKENINLGKPIWK